MAQFTRDDISDIYWAANDGFKGGRDPMGIQNSSIATYGRLLPGMTNLTGHIRYYSLYCWLLCEYDRLERDERLALHQYNFIRRAELIIAYVMRGLNMRSVVGANFVQYKSDNIRRGDVYDIAAGADYENAGKYWAFRSGAFGQYYLGSLIHYGLVKIADNRFYVRDNGKALAEALRCSVPGDILDLMLQCIVKGELTGQDMADLSPIGLHAIDPESDEWKMLNGYLLMRDSDGSDLRRESVYLMLADRRDGYGVGEFVERRFRACREEDGHLGARFGWYFYYMCEAFHYGVESLLCHILDCIGRLRNPAVDMLIGVASDEILQNLQYEALYDTVEEWAGDCDTDICTMFHRVKDNIRGREYAAAAADALRLFHVLYNEYRHGRDRFIEFEKRNDLLRQRGILSEGLDDYVGYHSHLSVNDYVKALICKVMNEHTFVAVGKMGKSDLDLRKFLLENDRVVLVEMRYPNETNPRIDTLHNFLVDLGYIAADGSLTDIARKFMTDYENE